MIKPSEYFKQGYTCAESIIKCYNEDFNDNIPLAIGSGMGRGEFSGSLCGAVNASVVVLGYVKGRNDNSESNEASTYVRELITRVKEKYSTELCRELKANKVSCFEIIDFSYETLKTLLG